jgi:uncharacterized protein
MIRVIADHEQFRRPHLPVKVRPPRSVFDGPAVRSLAGLRTLLLFLYAASVGGSGCNRIPNQTRMESSSQLVPTIAALRAAYQAFNRGDIDAAVEAFDAQIEWTEPVEFPGGGTYHGRDEVKRYLTQSRAAWAEASSEPERFITAGNRIVVLVHARVRSKGSKQWQDVRLADVYTVRGGKVIEMRAFADRQEALRWAGVPDRSP